MTPAASFKVLAALDRSPHSQAVARYLGGLLGGGPARVTLMHVLSKVPESFYDLGDLPTFKNKALQIRAWDQQEENRVRQALEEARQILLRAGLERETLTMKMHPRKEGVARDILHESSKGYAALALGRRGLSPLKDLVMGSTAHKLLSASHRVPVCVVDGEPDPTSFLVAVDGSEGSLKAMQMLADLVEPKGRRVRMIHVQRKLGFAAASASNDFPPEVEEAWVQEAQNVLGPFMVQARDILVEAGWQKDQIDYAIINGASSRAESIVSEAREGGWGSIVMGRRGLSRVQEFFMGRVTNKVLNLAQGQAVWVVS